MLTVVEETQGAIEESINFVLRKNFYLNYKIF